MNYALPNFIDTMYSLLMIIEKIVRRILYLYFYIECKHFLLSVNLICGIYIYCHIPELVLSCHV